MAEDVAEGRKYSGFVPGSYAIDGYGAGGFRFADMSHKGSILALPSGVHAWAVASPAEIDESSLAPLFAEPRGAVELLFIGCGATPASISKTLRDKLSNSGLRADTMATGSALATYNILREEGRRVAAALIAVP